MSSAFGDPAHPPRGASPLPPDGPPFLSVDNFNSVLRLLASRFEAMALRGLLGDLGDLGDRGEGLELVDSLGELGGVPPRRFLYKTMTDIEASVGSVGSGAEVPLHTLNRAALDVVTEMYRAIAEKRASGRSAAEASPGSRKSAEPGLPEDTSALGFMTALPELHGGTSEPSEPSEPSASRLAPLRGDVDIGDPYAEFERKYSEMSCATSGNFARWTSVGGELERGEGGSNAEGGGQSTLIPRATKKRAVDKYLFVNGLDRKQDVYPFRYRFSADLTTGILLQNVKRLQCTRLVLPGEIQQPETLGTAMTNTNTTLKTNFRYDFGVPYPFVILNIAEFENIYRSPSKASSTAFAHMVFARTFNYGQNCRSYMIMEAVQDEAATFDVNPLAQLNNLTVSVLSPSGALLNESRDDSLVRRLSIAEVAFNNTAVPGYRVITVETHTVFDLNEFYKGDVVRISNFKSYGPNAPALDGFINREIGHRILDIPDMMQTTDGLCTGFRIAAPGHVNPVTGVFQPDLDSWTDIRALDNALSDLAGEYWRMPASTPSLPLLYSGSYPSFVTPEGTKLPALAKVVNVSLQISLAFTVTCLEDDVTVGS